MELKGHFAINDLAVLNFTKSAERDNDPAPALDVIGVDLLHAPDLDGTTRGQSRDGWGWNCLVQRDDIDVWTERAKVAGYDVETVDATVGHYGDGQWNGVDLAEDPRDSKRCYWIER